MELYTFKPTYYVSFRFEEILGCLQKLSNIMWKAIWLLHSITFSRQVSNTDIEYLTKTVEVLEETVKELKASINTFIEAVKNSQDS
jgi:cell division protein FtsB